MMCVKKLGLIVGLVLGSAAIVQAAKAQDPVSAVGAAVNQLGTEAGKGVTGVLDKVTGNTTAVPSSSTAIPMATNATGGGHHRYNARHHDHHRHDYYNHHNHPHH